MIGLVYVHVHDDVYALQPERDLSITTPFGFVPSLAYAFVGLPLVVEGSRSLVTCAKVGCCHALAGRTSVGGLDRPCLAIE